MDCVCKGLNRECALAPELADACVFIRNSCVSPVSLRSKPQNSHPNSKTEVNKRFVLKNPKKHQRSQANHVNVHKLVLIFMRFSCQHQSTSNNQSERCFFAADSSLAGAAAGVSVGVVGAVVVSSRARFAPNRTANAPSLAVAAWPGCPGACARIGI